MINFNGNDFVSTLLVDACTTANIPPAILSETATLYDYTQMVSMLNNYATNFGYRLHHINGDVVTFYVPNLL